jgi:hypothetical protein
VRAVALLLLAFPSWAADLPEFSRKRNVPRHPASIMKDCPAEQARTISEAIGSAISIGAPAYNDGDVETCFKVYEQTAVSLDKRVKGCAGLKKALLAGVADAKRWDGYADKAWAMRDAFDGVLAVVEKNVPAAEPAKPAPRERNVPVLEPSALTDCSADALLHIRSTIANAIGTGAPLFNAGRAGDCYRLYSQAAANLRKEVSGCAGIKEALRTGAAEAKTLSDDADRAWALRDAFDGVLLVIEKAR